MPDAFSKIRRIIEASSSDDAWNALIEALKGFGFDRAIYAATRSRRESSVGDIQDAVFLSNFTLEAGKVPVDPGVLMRTPMFRWIMQNSGACSWGWAEEERRAGRVSKQEAEAQDLARRAGISAGYVISFTDPNPRHAAVISLVAAEGRDQAWVDSDWLRDGAEVQLLCQTLHLKIHAMPLKVQRRSLSPRQRETLEWVAEGKTTQDIATIMGISPGMVEKHLRLARECLDVETTAQAVAKAAMFNHLFSRPEPAPKR